MNSFSIEHILPKFICLYLCPTCKKFKSDKEKGMGYCMKNKSSFVNLIMISKTKLN